MTQNTEQIKGTAKVAAGAVTGDKKLENEGRLDRYAGDAKAKVGEATDKAEELLDTAKDGATSLLEKTRSFLNDLIDRVKR